jgi:hypothetical protein
MYPEMPPEVLGAILHLTLITNNRNPPLGYKRGQAVGPEDFSARRTVLLWLVEKFPNSMLIRLLTADIDQRIAGHRIFNQFLDGKMNYVDTLEECNQRCKASGHETTPLEWTMTSKLLHEASFVLNSPYDGWEFLITHRYSKRPFSGPPNDFMKLHREKRDRFAEYKHNTFSLNWLFVRFPQTTV